MGTRVRELPRIMDLPAGSGARRPDRVYEDQVWALALRLGPGHHVHDRECCRG